MIGGLVERPNPTLSEHVEWYSVWSQLVTFLFYPPFTLKLGTDNPGSARIIRCAFDFAVEYSIRGRKAIFSQKFPFFRFSFLSVYWRKCNWIWNVFKRWKSSMTHKAIWSGYWVWRTADVKGTRTCYQRLLSMVRRAVSKIVCISLWSPEWQTVCGSLPRNMSMTRMPLCRTWWQRIPISLRRLMISRDCNPSFACFWSWRRVYSLVPLHSFNHSHTVSLGRSQTSNEEQAVRLRNEYRSQIVRQQVLERVPSIIIRNVHWPLHVFIARHWASDWTDWSRNAEIGGGNLVWPSFWDDFQSWSAPHC